LARRFEDLRGRWVMIARADHVEDYPPLTRQRLVAGLVWLKALAVWP
jgi:hypothetical protein